MNFADYLKPEFLRRLISGKVEINRRDLEYMMAAAREAGDLLHEANNTVADYSARNERLSQQANQLSSLCESQRIELEKLRPHIAMLNGVIESRALTEIEHLTTIQQLSNKIRSMGQ